MLTLCCMQPTYQTTLLSLVICGPLLLAEVLLHLFDLQPPYIQGLGCDLDPPFQTPTPEVMHGHVYSKCMKVNWNN